MVPVSSWPHFLHRLVAGLALALTSAAVAQQPSVTAEISPSPFGTNQQAELTITITNGQPSGVPAPALPPPLTLVGNVSQSQQMFINNGVASLSVSFTYGITCAQPGTYTIPAIDVFIGGQTIKTQPFNVEVKPADQLNMPQGRTPGQDNNLGRLEPILQLSMPKTEFYQGEIVPIISTLYVLRGDRINLRRIGLIEVEKTDLAIQRFPQQPETSYETLGNKNYTAYTFRSTLSALKTGKMKVGPAKVELIVGVFTGNRTFFGMQEEQQKITVLGTEIAINVLPLPTEGKPKGFSGAVGDFSMTASANTAQTTVGDPVAVDVQISGSGNFDAIDAPKLSDPSGWKTYPAKRYNVDNADPNTADLMNRRLGFNTIIVPEKVMPAVPPFEFIFFSPTSKQYTTLRSQPIPLTIAPSPNAPANTGTTSAGTTVSGTTPKAAGPAPAPEADITDILMPIPATPRWAAVSTPLFSDQRFLVFNIALGLGLIALVVVTLTQQAKQRLASSPARALNELLHHVQEPGLTEAEFYQLAARYVNKATAGQPPADTQPILQKYEALNFAGPGAGTGNVQPAERTQVIGLLKQIKPVLSLLLLFIVSSAHADGDSAYQSAVLALQKSDFKTAQQQAETAIKEGHIGPDIFTLLGHATYKQGQPGLAAVWYQRAQLFPGAAPEIRQNLRHIHDKVPFFTRGQNQLLERLGLTLKRNTWAWLLTLGSWLCVFATALAWKTRRWWPLSIVPIGALLAAFALIGWLVRPSYESIARLAFVTSPKAQAHTAASQTSGTVINVPPGSIVKQLDQRGTWSYVEIYQDPDNLRGWLPTAQIEAVWPYEPAKLP